LHEIQIEIATGVTDELRKALGRLIPQLGGKQFAPSDERLKALLAASGSTLLLARLPVDGGAVVGMLSLTVYPVPTGIRAIIEDVVVDEAFRSRGIARSLIHAALEIARSQGAGGVTLTSNPRRVAANHLYQKMGFIRRETNSYYFDLQKNTGQVL
jgi:ribosomal protein S18 acetylase RimI-like enzyme